MSAFSRGCLRRQCTFNSPRILNYFQPINTPYPRFFNTTSLLRAARKSPAVRSKAPVPQKLSLTPTKSSPSKSPVYTTFADTLATKPHPTPLYEAPSHTLFIICAYAGAATCFGYSIYNTYTVVLNPTPGLKQWVPIAFVGVAFFMSAAGTWLILSTSKIIRTITAIPKNTKQITRAINKNTPKASGKSTESELQLEIVLRKMLPIPFFPARVIYATPSEILLPTRISPPPPASFSAAELRQMRIEDEARIKQEVEYERSHIMTSPFRQMSRIFHSVFKAIGKTWTGEGFMIMQVKGSRYRLDVSGGWAMDGGKALDRLVTINPTVDA